MLNIVQTDFPYESVMGTRLTIIIGSLARTLLTNFNIANSFYYYYHCFSIPIGLQEAQTLIRSMISATSDIINTTVMMFGSLATAVWQLVQLNVKCFFVINSSIRDICMRTRTPINSSLQALDNGLPPVSSNLKIITSLPSACMYFCSLVIDSYQHVRLHVPRHLNSFAMYITV